LGWIESVGDAINYIEDHITEELSMDEIAGKVFLSPFYFQKGFSMLCGFTVGEYVRLRRLTLAGSELVLTDAKIIDIAVKYGYDSPDSFTKAFTRFHGVTPSAIRKEGAMMKSFAPLMIEFNLKGGFIMDYKVIEKDAFTVLGASKMFKYDTAKTEIPAFWTAHHQNGKDRVVCGIYGICIDERKGMDEFEYLIADNYNPAAEVPEGFVTRVIPKHNWAVFPCKGAMPDAIQSVNHQIFSEWLPNCREYEIAAGYNVEMYDDPTNYPKGLQDENYYTEIWIPVKKK
jgi:AraC family transcriptional regulator